MFTCLGCQRELAGSQSAYENVCQACMASLCIKSVAGKPVVTDYARALSIVANDACPDDWRKYQVSFPELARGPWRIERMPDGLAQFAARIVFVMLEGPARDIGPGPYTRLVKADSSGGFKGWMTDSRLEVLEHYPLLRRLESAKPGSSVLINGLGLGVAARAALRRPEIARVDVVELDPDVAAMVEPLIADRRLTVHLADAHVIGWPEGQSWDMAWHDIWVDISPANLPSLRRLQEKYSRLAGWQGAWAHE